MLEPSLWASPTFLREDTRLPNRSLSPLVVLGACAAAATLVGLAGTYMGWTWALYTWPGFVILLGLPAFLAVRHAERRARGATVIGGLDQWIASAAHQCGALARRLDDAHVPVDNPVRARLASLRVDLARDAPWSHAAMWRLQRSLEELKDRVEDLTVSA